MHVALHDVGILYASAICHGGWLRGRGVGGGKDVLDDPVDGGLVRRRRARVRHRRLHARGLHHPELVGHRVGHRRSRHPYLRGLDRQRHGLLGGAARRRDRPARRDRPLAVAAHEPGQGPARRRQHAPRSRDLPVRHRHGEQRPPVGQRRVPHAADRRRGADRFSYRRGAQEMGPQERRADRHRHLRPRRPDRRGDGGRRRRRAGSPRSTRRGSSRSSSCGRPTSGRP